MENFQQKTEAIFTRRTLENAFDRQDWDEVFRMAQRMDDLTVQRLDAETEQRTATA